MNIRENYLSVELVASTIDETHLLEKVCRKIPDESELNHSKCWMRKNTDGSFTFVAEYFENPVR